MTSGVLLSSGLFTSNLSAINLPLLDTTIKKNTMKKVNSDSLLLTLTHQSIYHIDKPPKQSGGSLLV
jgi:hypothetical protein